LGTESEGSSTPGVSTRSANADFGKVFSMTLRTGSDVTTINRLTPLPPRVVGTENLEDSSPKYVHIRDWSMP
jgi:hypothetical protein